ncbi:MAG: hypothetical protein ONA90_04845 [candidate division KSB1 bacterium]|nr:hypothetical protein [candidate division KSB1 bacterium]
MQVLPVINCLDLECVIKTLQQIERFLPPDGWIHLDIADGRFTFHKTWNEPSLWPNLRCSHSLEVHLMTEEPAATARGWLENGARRIIVHYEVLTADGFKTLLNLTNAYGAEVMLAFNPETPAEALRPYFGRLKSYQVLAVHPGAAGQTFLPLVLPKISFLRREVPDAKIEVDGGITPAIAKKVKEAGATAITSAYYVLAAHDPAAAYIELTRI